MRKAIYKGIPALAIAVILLTACAQKADNLPAARETQGIYSTTASSHTTDTEESPSPTPPRETASPAPASPQPSSTPTAQVKDVKAASPEKIKEAEALYEQGYRLYNAYKYDEAIGYFNQAIEADSGCYKAYNGKGIALCFKGRYEEGMPLIRKALDMKQDFAYANFNMAMAYKLQKDYDSALIWFNKAISYDPKDTWSYYGISTIYADWNQVEKSLDYLKKAIDLEPEVKGVAKEQDHFARMRNNPEFIKLTK